MSDNDDRGVMLSFLAGIGMGAIVGAAAALLLTPKSGPETREDLKKVAQDLSKSTEEFRKRTTEMLDTAKTKVQQAYEAGREAVQKRRGGGEASEPAPEA